MYKQFIDKLLEANVKLCPTCGKSMAGNHYWYKGGWKCKGVNPKGGSKKSTTAGTAGVKPTKISNTPLPPDVTRILVDGCGIKPANITVLPTGEIDITGNVVVTNLQETQLPFSINRVIGSFSISHCENLNTLKGCPKIVDNVFAIADCRSITSLEYGPTSAHTYVATLSFNDLVSLVGLPRIIDGCLAVEYSSLQSYDGLPQICHEMRMTSFTNMMDTAENFRSFVEALQGMKHLSILAIYSSRKPKEPLPLLGLFNVNGLKTLRTVENAPFPIVSEYLSTNHDMFACQDKMIDMGYDEWASL